MTKAERLKNKAERSKTKAERPKLGYYDNDQW